MFPDTTTGGYAAEFTAVTPFGTSTGGPGRHYRTTRDALRDVVACVAQMARDPVLSASHLTLRLSVRA